MLGICLLIVSIYAMLVLWMNRVFVKGQTTPTSSLLKTSFSIVIPCRNEVHNLAICLDSILSNRYPTENYEIVLVNDHSDDGTWELMQAYAKKWDHIHVFELEGEQGKKSALTKGIQHSSNPWIITRDADTTQGQKWLSTLSDVVESCSEMKVMILPVLPSSGTNTLHSKIVSLEFLSLMGSGLACALGKRPILANGANFAFRKDWFKMLGGYTEHSHLSSGDDVLFLQATIRRGKHHVGVCVDPESAVETPMPPDLNAWMQQRIRWGGKMSALHFNDSSGISLLVLFANLALLLSPFILTIPHPTIVILTLWTLKLYPDWIFMKTLTRHFSRESSLWTFVLLAVIYPAALCVSVAMIFVKKPRWKGRKIQS